MAFEAIRRSHTSFNAKNSHNLSLGVAKLNSIIDDWEKKEHDSKDAALKNMEQFKFQSEAAKAYRNSFTRWEKAIKSREDCDFFEIEAVSRVLLGTGNASVFEFGFNLNYPWGVPYISGSSLKGLVSSYLARHGGAEWERSNESSAKSDAQVELFGGTRSKSAKDSKSYSGTLVFHDAWLAEVKSRSGDRGDWFDADIITPHYSKYYAGLRLPDGTENPVPIKVAALCPGLKFLVAIQGPEEYRKFARDILVKALEEEGIGGKTSVGYGRFRYIPSKDEENQTIINDIKSAASPEALKELYDKHKNRKELRKDFNMTLEKIGYSEGLKRMFEELQPLEFLYKQVEKGEIKTLKILNERFRSLKNTIDKSAEADGYESLKKSAYGRKLFNIILSKWKEDLKTGGDLGVVKALAYTWEDLDLSADALLDEIQKKDRIWPPLKDLSAFLEKNREKFDEDTLEIIMLELDGSI